MRLEISTIKQESELVFTRVYKAPRALVFDACTDPKHIANWWGPDGFTTTTTKMDLRVDGAWEYVMRGPDGTEYPSRAVFMVVDKPSELIFSNVGGRKDDPHLTCVFRITFEEANGETHLTLCMSFPDEQRLEHARTQGAEQGGHEALARLANLIDGMLA